MPETRTISVDFLERQYFRYRWPWRYFPKKTTWRIFSGDWILKSPNSIYCKADPKVKTGENLSVYGSERWENYTFEVRFRISTTSIKPPEGGAILYFNYSGKKDFYSFHFCPSKQRIEMIKRVKGRWATLGKKSCDLHIGKENTVRIVTNNGLHKCSMDGNNLLEILDDRIQSGCIGIGTKYCDTEFMNVSIRFH